MFDNVRKQLELQTLGKGNKGFTITENEFKEFCKSHLFELIKGDKKLGQFFCEKYNEHNYVLSILNNKAAEAHIRRFYVK